MPRKTCCWCPNVLKSVVKYPPDGVSLVCKNSKQELCITCYKKVLAKVMMQNQIELIFFLIFGCYYMCKTCTKNFICTCMFYKKLVEGSSTQIFQSYIFTRKKCTANIHYQYSKRCPQR